MSLGTDRNLTGFGSLPFYVLDSDSIKRNRNHIRPYKYPYGFKNDPLYREENPQELYFSAWQLFHGAYKTAVLKYQSYSELDTNVLNFANQNLNLFKWNIGNLRLKPGMSNYYKDSARAEFASRIGEGIACLFFHEQGYFYWDQLQNIIERAINRNEMKRNYNPKKARFIKKYLSKIPPKRPDFLFENAIRENILVESKGRIIGPNRRSDIKSDLKDALKQLDMWPKFILPKPKNHYAIGTYVREVSDPNDEPSLIALTDPEHSDIGKNAINIDLEVRIGNYAFWLYSMGFGRAGDNLLYEAKNTLMNHYIPTIKLDKHSYALIPISWNYNPPHRFYPFSLKFFWESLGENGLLPLSNFPIINYGIKEFQLFCIGMEVDTLKIIEDILNTKDVKLLYELPDLDIKLDTVNRLEIFRGSILKDGSIMGMLNVNLATPPDIEIMEFRL